VSRLRASVAVVSLGMGRAFLTSIQRGFRVSAVTWFLLLALSGDVTGSDAPWRWIAGQVTPSGWFTTQGIGTVTITERRVSAKLFDGEDTSRLRRTVEGEISGQRFSATVITQDSDVGPDKMSGSYSRRVHGEQEFQAFIVHNEWAFLAMTRTLPRPKR